MYAISYILYQLELKCDDLALDDSFIFSRGKVGCKIVLRGGGLLTRPKVKYSNTTDFICVFGHSDMFTLCIKLTQQCTVKFGNASC